MIDGIGVSSSSQPAIMAVMLEQLQVGAAMRVLEIGAGTGYNAALLAALVGPQGRVVSLDLDQDVVDSAAAHLAAAGSSAVEVVCADGADGWPAAAPYDRIVLTVGAPDVFPAWVEELAPDGLLLLPLGLGGGVQRSVAFKRAHGQLESVSVEPCGFMPLRGRAEEADVADFTSVHPEPGVRCVAFTGSHLSAERLRDWLGRPGPELATGVAVSTAEAWGSLQLWLSLQEPAFCALGAGGGAAERPDLPGLLVGGGARGSYGLLGDKGLCLLSRPEPQQPAVSVRVYGDDPGLADRLKRLLLAWDATGRPCGQGLRLLAFPAGREPVPRPGQRLIRKAHHSLLLECD